MAALDLDYLDEEHIQLNAFDPDTNDWIPPDGERGRRCTELFCLACRKHLERTTLNAHLESAKHRNWIEWNAEVKKTALQAQRTMKASIAPPSSLDSSSLRTHIKKVHTLTPPPPPPSKIPKRPLDCTVVTNDLDPLPRNRLKLTSKAPPTTQAPRNHPAEPEHKIVFVKQEEQLEDFNKTVLQTLRQIPQPFPPLPPVPPKAEHTSVELVLPPKPPLPEFREANAFSPNAFSHNMPNIIISPSFHQPSWGLPPPQNWWQSDSQSNFRPSSSSFTLPPNLNGNVVFNQQGRPMLLIPL
jgi:hypothetical protein